MKKVLFLSLIIITVFSACGKDTFYDKFVPEILYYEKNDVENLDFSEVALAAGVTEFVVKARVSAPMKLKEIKVFRIADNQNEVLLQTYNDFQLNPNVFRLNYALKGIAASTTLKVFAIDLDNKSSAKIFVIKK
jgi:hypothetical protein